MTNVPEIQARLETKLNVLYVGRRAFVMGDARIRHIQAHRVR